MNVKIMKAMGYEDEMVLVKFGKCPLCRKEVKREEFVDQSDWDEYVVSGICKRCQDKVFNKPSND